MRDETCVDLGVRVEDRADGALWKLDDPATMRRELQAKAAAERETKAKKLLNKLNVKAADLAKAAAAAVTPEQMKAEKFAGCAMHIDMHV